MFGQWTSLLSSFVPASKVIAYRRYVRAFIILSWRNSLFGAEIGKPWHPNFSMENAS